MTVVLQRGGNRISALDCEIFVMQEHFDGSRDFRRSEFVYGSKNPCSLNEDERRYPCAFANERFRGSGLLSVVARDKTNQHVRVNGAHACSSYSAAGLY